MNKNFKESLIFCFIMPIAWILLGAVIGALSPFIEHYFIGDLALAWQNENAIYWSSAVFENMLAGAFFGAFIWLCVLNFLNFVSFAVELIKGLFSIVRWILISLEIITKTIPLVIFGILGAVLGYFISDYIGFEHLWSFIEPEQMFRKIFTSIVIGALAGCGISYLFMLIKQLFFYSRDDMNTKY